MAEIYKDSITPVKTKIFWGGEIVNADNDEVQATVYDITEDPTIFPPLNPEVEISQSMANKIETDNGSYQLVLSTYYTDRSRKLKIVWDYQIDGYDGQHSTYVDVVTPYVSLEEVIEDLSLGSDANDPNNKTYHELRMAEKYARKMVEYYTGQKFYLHDDKFTIVGNDSDTLPLSYKINSLHTLHANDQLLIDNLNDINYLGYTLEPTTSGFGIKINQSSFVDNTVYVANGMLPPSISDISPNIFRRGHHYDVYARFGWEDVPDDVEQATIEIMRSYFAKDRVWKDRYVNKISTTDWNFQYASDAFSGTGSAYADKLLLDYVVTQMVVV